MRSWTLLTLVGVLVFAGSALAQDPNDAFIPDIQNGLFAENDFLQLNGKVVTGLAPFGLWVQEPAFSPGIQRSGIWCYTQVAPTASVGDLVDLSGIYIEFNDLTEIDVTVGGSVTIVGGMTVPDAPVLALTDINTGSPTAEDWEGVLVQINEDVEVQTHIGFGDYTVSPLVSPLDLLFLDDKCLDAPPLPDIGSQFSAITGLHDFGFDEYRLMPRDNDDLVWLAGEPAPGIEIAYCRNATEVVIIFDRRVVGGAEDEFNYFFQNNPDGFATAASQIADDMVLLTVTTPFVGNNVVPEQLDVSNVENQAGTPMGTVSTTFIAGISTIDFVQTIGSGLDSSQVVGQPVTIEGIVTGDNTFDYIPPSGNRYYMQMPTAGQLSGIFVFDRFNPVEKGDEIRVAGPVAELGFTTEIDDPVYVEILSRGNDIPGPDLLTVADISSGAAAEPWEGVFVRLENVEVAETHIDTTFGRMELAIINVGVVTDSVDVGDEGNHSWDEDASVGEIATFVQGPLATNFGPVLQPRQNWDIGRADGVGVGDQGSPDAARTALRGSHPNPFNPSTTISFELRERGKVDLRIYDQNGRLVRTLLDTAVRAGEHHVQWDGRDNNGRQVTSGVYHYRFEADGVVESRKISLVK